MFTKKTNDHDMEWYRLQLLSEMSGNKSKKTMQAWFRNNQKSVHQIGDVADYLKKFCPYFK